LPPPPPAGDIKLDGVRLNQLSLARQLSGSLALSGQRLQLHARGLRPDELLDVSRRAAAPGWPRCAAWLRCGPDRAAACATACARRQLLLNLGGRGVAEGLERHAPMLQVDMALQRQPQPDGRSDGAAAAGAGEEEEGEEGRAAAYGLQYHPPPPLYQYGAPEGQQRRRALRAVGGPAGEPRSAAAVAPAACRQPPAASHIWACAAGPTRALQAWGSSPFVRHLPLPLPTPPSAGSGYPAVPYTLPAARDSQFQLRRGPLLISTDVSVAPPPALDTHTQPSLTRPALLLAPSGPGAAAAAAAAAVPPPCHLALHLQPPPHTPACPPASTG
jgi:hypothetical protein